jgi:tetratricopeptide (TPR) repeat protein
MKIFGLNPNNRDFKITEEDRLWVEENFRWLKEVFGYPNKSEEQVLLTRKFFPATFSAETITIDNVIADMCQLFGISRDAVKYETVIDLRDYNNVPYGIEGKAFECETELKKGQYTIFVANSLLKHPERLIYSLIYEFIRIRRTSCTPVAAATECGKKWNYISEMPQPVMAFSLATYANLRGEHDPSWKNEFNGDLKKMLESAIAYVKANPNDLYDEAEIKASDLFNQANDHFERNQLDEAIATLQKILFLTNDAHLKADVYNNMGYYYLQNKDYRQGISNFRKALALGPEYGFANDNLGYALIMTGELEEGVSYLEKAMETGNNDPAYTFRNFARYHQGRCY